METVDLRIVISHSLGFDLLRCPKSDRLITYNLFLIPLWCGACGRKVYDAASSNYMTAFFMELIFSRQKSFHLTNKRYENVRPILYNIFWCTNTLDELDKDVRTNVYDI